MIEETDHPGQDLSGGKDMNAIGGPPPALPRTPVARRAWLRDAAFLALCLGAAALIGGTLWERDTPTEPAAVQSDPVAPDDVAPAVAKLDAALEHEWLLADIAPAGVASDFMVARRLSLALTGTIPSLEEIRALDARPAEERMQWWLTHLLGDRRHADYFGERFARAFVGVENGPFLVYRRHRLVSWLSDQFHENRPYDELVRNLIAADGIWTSEPEVNFVTVTLPQNNPDKKGPDEVRLAGRVTRAFLGVRIDCMECHDDKFGDRWKQKDFHQLAAFFGDAEMSLTGLRDKSSQEYEYRYLRQREAEVVPAVVPFRNDLLPATGNLRAQLAGWVTHPENRAFARATVNRLWALLFNRPLIDPIDEIPLDGPWPPAMEILADELIARDFDLRHVIRVIASSRAFRLESRSADPEAPLTDRHGELWAGFPVTRLRPEQVAGSIIQASSLKTIDADSHIIKRFFRVIQQSDFVKRYGDLGENEFADQGGTIPQRLVMMNGKLVEERIKENMVLNASTRIGALAPDDAAAVETAYLAVFSRSPTAEERDHFVAAMSDTKGKARSRAMADLYWALMNSTEFSWNH